MAPFTFRPLGPFDLETQNEYFGGWPTLAGNSRAIAVASPIEGWQTSVVVVVEQDTEKQLSIEVFGAGGDEDKAVEQALAALSLDIDARAWPEVGERDEHIGRLQSKYKFLRPV